MKQWVAFKLDDGSTIVVETDEPETGLTTRGLGRAGGITEAGESFAQALSKIRPATEQVITALSELVKKPQEIEMEFGFSLNATAGVVIASASAQANYKVTLRWMQETQETNL